MKIKFEFPTRVKQFVKNEILNSLNENLLDKNYKPIKCKEIRIVVNGFHKAQKNRIFISPKKISKKKPLRTISACSFKYSIYYLIFKEK